MINKKNILLFLLFAFGLSWLSAGIQYACGIKYGSGLSVILTATTFMYGPAIAAVVLQKFFSKTPAFNYGLRLKSSNGKGWLVVFPVYLGFIAFTLGVMAVLGNVLHVPGCAALDFSAAHLKEVLDEASKAAGVPQSPLSGTVNGWGMLVLVILGAIIAGPTINLLATFGEEYGWRGALSYELRSLGFWKSGLLIGTIWGLWHAPVILQGHNYPDHPVAGVFMMVPFCIGLALLMAYLRVKTKSVFGPAVMHGMINASGSGLIILALKGNFLYGFAGAAGAGGALLTVALIYIFDRKTILRYEEILSEEKPVVSTLLQTPGSATGTA